MTKRVALILTVLFLAVGASVAVLRFQIGNSDLQPKVDSKAAARAWLAKVDYSSAHTTISMLRRSGATAVRIKVTSIEGPIWNSSDGRAWEGNEGVEAQVYSRVTATVEQSLRGKSLSSPLSFYTLGDATNRYEGAEAPPAASVSGGFIIGESFVVFLLEDDVPFEDRVEKAWFHTGEYQANWRLRDQEAIAPVVSRSMPIAQLMSDITS